MKCGPFGLEPTRPLEDHQRLLLQKSNSKGSNRVRKSLKGGFAAFSIFVQCWLLPELGPYFSEIEPEQVKLIGFRIKS